MTTQIDIDDAKYREAARQMIWRHDNFEVEANVTSAVRDFLITTRLAASEEIVEENPPSEGSRRAVDLTALDTFIEVKRRISTAASGLPNPEYVRQLDDYLAQSAKDKRERLGVLTDGRHWLLRWPGAGDPRMTRPYYFRLQDADDWFLLYEWLRDEALFSLFDVPPTRDNIRKHLGPANPWYHRDTDTLRGLHRQYASAETIRIKRDLWRDLLRAALGEVAGPGLDESMDDLFVRHTYLTAVIGIAVQASFGLDIRAIAEADPADLVYGRDFRNKTGLQGVVESDFFAWPAEVGGLPLLRAIARRVARFDWQAGDIPNDIASILYETVIPAEERRTLGEYYTPQWLAKTMVRELVDSPLEQRVLDPACGSGTFVAEATSNYLEAAQDSGVHPSEVFGKLRDSVTGIDIHPVAVHLARAAYVLVARTAIQDAVYTSVTVPIYLGDALQLRYRAGDMFAEHEVTIQVNDEENTELVFPVGLVERPDTFDAFIGDVAEHIASGYDPEMALSDHCITGADRELLGSTIAEIQRLHSEGRDHIWAYYTRNMVRPVALGRSKVDVVIGNPPWINYNQTVDILRTEFERQSKDTYGIWAGGRYSTHQDVAGLFFARCVDLYLEAGGRIGFVMPHSALQAGQYSKWRKGAWRSRRGLRTLSVDFGFKAAWDLERLEPNNFFPMPASVVFAKNLGLAGKAAPLAGEVERWYGRAGSADVVRGTAAVTDTGVAGKFTIRETLAPGRDHRAARAILRP